MAGQKIFKLQTQGFSQAMTSQEDELRLIFLDIANERGGMAKLQSPEARLAFMVCSTLMMCNARNSQAPAPAEAPAPVPADIETKFSDL